MTFSEERIAEIIGYECAANKINPFTIDQIIWAAARKIKEEISSVIEDDALIILCPSLSVEAAREVRRYLRQSLSQPGTTVPVSKQGKQQRGVPAGELSNCESDRTTTDVKHAPGNGLDKHTYELVATWISNGMKERSEHAFTAGLARDVAFLVQLGAATESVATSTYPQSENTQCDSALSVAPETACDDYSCIEDHEDIGKCRIRNGNCGCSCHKEHESEDGLDHLNGEGNDR